MKAIVCAGGTGSRLLPLTKCINKHLLPVGPLPMIYHPLRTLVNGGVDDIMIVSGGSHLGDIIETIGESFEGISITYKPQSSPDGIAGAIGRAERWVGSESVVVVLGDNIFDDLFMFKPITGARVFLKFTRYFGQYGVPEFVDDKICGFEEKPEVPKSNYAVTGIYQFDHTVFDIIRQCVPSKRGELEVTDVLNFYARKDLCKYKILKGFWCDAGTFEGLSMGNFHFYGQSTPTTLS
jgi:glucose-1-phosphate thymidylyltransferase